MVKRCLAHENTSTRYTDNNSISFVPALAVGFDDVTKRMETQEKQALAHLATLKETEAKINKLRNNDAQATAKKLDEYRTRHMELTERVIWVSLPFSLLQPQQRVNQTGILF